MSDLVGLPREPAAHTNARLLLKQHGRQPRAIIRVEPDCVIYRDHAEQVRTAWIYLVADRPRVFVEPGMPAWPSVPLPPASPAAVRLDDSPEYDDA